MSPEPIRHYFNSNYGETTSVSLHAQESHIYAIVHFVEPDSAQKASLPGQHSIAGNQVHIMSSIPSQNRSPLSLIDLNNDSWRTIFDHLEVKDLWSIAAVCTRLKEVVVLYVSENPNPLAFVLKKANTELSDRLCELDKTNRTLSLKVDRSFDFKSHNIILKFLMQYCGYTLVNLVVHGLTFNPQGEVIEDSQSPYSRVRKVTFINCFISVKWFRKCREIEEVELKNTQICFEGIKACPSLKSLKIDVYSRSNHDGLEDFLQRNPQLKALHIDYDDDDDEEYFDIFNFPQPSLLQFVSPSIESLSFPNAKSSDLTRFHALKQLRLLEMSSIFDLGPLVNRNANSLEYFQIIEIKSLLKLDERDVDAISRLKNLKTLILSIHACKRGQFQRMVENLNELEDLRIGTQKNSFSENDLLQIIRNKPSLHFLHLSFRYNGNGSLHVEN